MTAPSGGTKKKHKTSGGIISTPPIKNPPIPRSVKLRRLGGVDLNGYCRSIGYADGANLDGPRVAPQAAFHWRCKSGDRTSSLSVVAACQSQYAGRGVTARAGNLDDAFSWTCYLPS